MQPEAFNLVSISANPVTALIGKPYYHLPSTVQVMERLRESVVDGFEIQNLAEWNKKNPPRDDVTGSRYTAWKKSPKYTVEEVAALLEGLPILSVHANRDVGISLCSDRNQDIDQGKTLITESLYLAEKVGAPVCVVHLWDTWKKEFDAASLRDTFCEVTAQYPGVKAAVENVPTHLKGLTPFDLVKEYPWITVDVRWAAMYDELSKFESLNPHIANVHLRGTLQDSNWVLNNAPFGFSQALDTVKTWEYTGVVTLEPEGGICEGAWDHVVKAMSSVRNEVQPQRV